MAACHFFRIRVLLFVAQARSYGTSCTESSVGAPGAGATSLSTDRRLESLTFSAPASLLSTQSTNALAPSGLGPPLIILTAPTSKPVGWGFRLSIGCPWLFAVRIS